MMAGDLARSLDPALWFHQAGITPDPWQEAAIRSPARRQLWLVHRQGGKSTTAALKALAKATTCPGSLTLLISPAQRQSAELLRKVVELHQAIPGLPKPVTESQHKLEFDPAHGGRVLSLPSSESNIRGFSRVALLILDEASRIPDAVITACKPMQAVAKDAELIALSTPWGERGWFCEQYTNGGPTWERTKVTAEECARIRSEERRVGKV